MMALAALSLNSFSCFFEKPYDPDSQHLPPLAGNLRAALLLHLEIQGLSGSKLKHYGCQMADVLVGP